MDFSKEVNLLTLILILLVPALYEVTATATSRTDPLPTKNRCYSCASDNMKSNFLNRTRGPRKRIKEPRLYDNMCDVDVWLIREKSATDCPGACFKWQQIFNNSGIYSYSTIRGCFVEMFDTLTSPTQSDLSSHSECNSSEAPLTDPRLDQSTIIENICWCQGDFCNSAEKRFGKVHICTLVLLLLLLISLK